VENSFYNLIRYIEAKTAFKCQSYKEKPLKRRLRVRMRALGVVDFSAYLEHLKRDPTEIERLLNILTINLSFFFRNPETFAFLQQHQFPEFKKKGESLILWSAGCANGEEPYSLAISAAESSLLHRVTIYGTDIDQGTVDQAQRGIYSIPAFQYTPDRVVQKYFTRTKAGYRVNDDIRARVHFLHLDLLEEPPFGPCNLIMCRNVLIYYSQPVVTAIITRFRDRLTSSGVLVLGASESVHGLGLPLELEYVNGEIWANIWYRDIIVRIDPTSGEVLGTIDLSGLYSSAVRDREEVANGINCDIAIQFFDFFVDF